MKQVKFTIDENEVEIYDQEQLKLALTFVIANITDMSSRNASFSKTITIPGTATNDLIFGFANDVNSDLSLTQNIKPNAKIEVDGNKLIEGFVKYERVQINETKHEYQIIIIGDNGDWKIKIENLLLSDLDFSEFDHDWTAANILTSELIDSSGGALTKPDIVYPLINYGVPKDTITNILETGVQVDMRYFAIQIYSYLKKIFNVQGYILVSNFFNSTFFRRLYLPFINEFLLMPESWKINKLFRAGSIIDLEIYYNINVGSFWSKRLIFDNDSTLGNFDNGGNFMPTTICRYIVPENSWQKFVFISNNGTGMISSNYLESVEINIVREPANYANLQIELQDYTPDTTIVLIRKQLEIISSDANFTYFNINFKIETDFIKYNLYDKISVWFVIKRCGTGMIGFDFIFKKEYTFFYNDILPHALPSNPLTLNINLPKIKQLDFFRAIIEKFNLMVITNVEERKIYVEPFDDFYSTNAIVWEDNNIHKLDVSKPIELTDINSGLNKKIIYGYKNDGSDKLVELKNQQNNIILGNNNIINSNQFVNGEQNIGQLLFAITAMDKWSYIGLTLSKVPTLNAEVNPLPTPSKFQTKFEPRILYYAGVVACVAGETWMDVLTIRTTYPYMYSVDEVTENDNSLWYCDTSKSNGLYKKYHKNKFELINAGKLLTAYFHLNDIDISNLDFRVPIFIIDSYFILNKIIDYDPLNSNSVKVELIKAINIDTIAILNKTNISIFKKPNLPIIPIPIPPEPYPVIPILPKYIPQPNGNLIIMELKTVGNNGANLVLSQKTNSSTKNLITIDSNGTLKSGNGSVVKGTINNVSCNMTFTDANGEEQDVVMSEI